MSAWNTTEDDVDQAPLHAGEMRDHRAMRAARAARVEEPGMKLALRLHHTSFLVKDLARSRAFYEGVLGLEPIPRPERLTFPGIWYRCGNGELHLLQAPEGLDLGSPPPKIHPLARHAALEVADYEATLAHLRAYGVELLPTNGELRQIWVQDPDGHVIEFIAP
jgi:catechol 2,3-dioxygenase-like lactoylglutathione lyase family enzyme